MKAVLKAYWQLIVGIFISVLFLYLAFRKVDLAQMGRAFRAARYGYLIPAAAVLFVSHWLRAIRWQYLLEPIGRLRLRTLFSSLLIGYMANTFLPAHLGEFVRAYLIGKKTPVSASAAFATIVVERIIDVAALLLLLAVAIFIFPFPVWVKTSGYLLFAGIFLLFILLALMKMRRDAALRLIGRLARPLSARLAQRLQEMAHHFLDGLVPLKNWNRYVAVFLLSFLIWFGYALSFQFGFYAFGFIRTFHLPWSAALVTLIVTTISVVVPSSPGYVGTYHYLCQLALGFFGIPEGSALTYAIVMHGINFLPILLVGLALLPVAGISLRAIGQKKLK